MEPLLSLVIQIPINQTLTVLLAASHHSVSLVVLFEIAPVLSTFLGYR